MADTHSIIILPKGVLALVSVWAGCIFLLVIV